MLFICDEKLVFGYAACVCNDVPLSFYVAFSYSLTYASYF